MGGWKELNGLGRSIHASIGRLHYEHNILCSSSIEKCLGIVAYTLKNIPVWNNPLIGKHDIWSVGGKGIIRLKSNGLILATKAIIHRSLKDGRRRLYA